MTLSAIKLSLQFDQDRIARDLYHLCDQQWVSHYNFTEFRNGWKGLALRSTDGTTDNLAPNEQDDYQNTMLLMECDYIKKVLNAFKCPLLRVRLMKLKAGAKVRKHIDRSMGLLHGKARLHIPVITNEGVHFIMHKERVEMKGGEVWYLDATRPHQVINLGDEDRLHLVIDCQVNEWLLQHFPYEVRLNSALEWIKYYYRFNKYIRFQHSRRKLKIFLSKVGIL